jgi:guanylate kinase
MRSEKWKMGSEKWKMEDSRGKERQPLLIVISGPTGSGKTTIARKLVSGCRDMVFSISHTTRLPRPGEKDGVDYHFVDEKAFMDKARRNEFMEWARVHGYCYGTHSSEWEKAKKASLDLVLDIDVQGGMQILKADPGVLLIFILPPSFDEMLKRLSKRNEEKSFDLKTRLETALKELDFAKAYHYNVVNEELDRALRQVKEILGASRRRSVLLDDLRSELKFGIEKWLREENV